MIPPQVDPLSLEFVTPVKTGVQGIYGADNYWIPACARNDGESNSMTESN